MNAGADLQSVPLTNIERHGLRFANRVPLQRDELDKVKSAPAVIRIMTSKYLKMRKTICLILTLILILTGFGCKNNSVTETYKADVIVYGGTSAAVTTAVQVHRMGQTVIIVSPDKHLGGMSSSGLGFTDTGNKEVIGGLGTGVLSAHLSALSETGIMEMAEAIGIWEYGSGQSGY